MNKSFMYGVIIASLTWTISLYLYSSITSENELHDQNSSEMHVLPSIYNKNVIDDGLLLNSIDDSDLAKEKSIHKNKIYSKNRMFEEKLSRYKKEQKNRAYNQKLLEELKPVAVYRNATGKKLV